MSETRKRKIVKWALIVLGVLGVLAIAGISGAALAARQFRGSQTIAPHVRIEGVTVGGMSRAEAMEAVRSGWVSRLPKRIKLQWPTGQIMLSPEQLGARLQIAAAVEKAYRLGREGGVVSHFITRIQLMRKAVDIPVAMEVDRAALEARVVELAGKVNQQPRNAKLTIKDGEVDIVPGRIGVQLDVAETTDMLAEELTDPQLAEATLVTRVQQPSIRNEDLQHFQTVLGSYTTKFNPGKRNRSHNLRMAIANLGQAVIRPGEVFSLNERLGPRIAEEGWRPAATFINGDVELSTGGGICQIGSTVYNAALLANLDIVERHHHSRPVDYVPLGRDATVYWGQLDVKIKNPFDTPILITGKAEENRLTIYVIGKREDTYDVEILRSGIETVPHSQEMKPDDELKIGEKETEQEGRNGHRVTVTQVVRKDGEVVKRVKLHTDYYRPQKEIVRVGTKVPPESEPPEEGLATEEGTGEGAPAGETETTSGPAEGTPSEGSGPAELTIGPDGRIEPAAGGGESGEGGSD